MRSFKRLVLASVLFLAFCPRLEATYAVIGHVEAGSSNTTSVTTGSLDTTGANLLIAATSDYDHASTLTITDSKSNSWTCRTASTTVSSPRARLCYSQGGTVGSGHTFTATGTGGGGTTYPAIMVLALSGSATSPADVQEQHDAAVGVTSLQDETGITPSVNNEIVLAVLANNAAAGTVTIDSGFTVNTQAYGSGTNMGGSLAYKIQTTAAAVNPTFSWATSTDASLVLDSFKASAGGGGGAVETSTMTLLGAGK